MPLLVLARIMIATCHGWPGVALTRCHEVTPANFNNPGSCPTIATQRPVETRIPTLLSTLPNMMCPSLWIWGVTSGPSLWDGSRCSSSFVALLVILVEPEKNCVPHPDPECFRVTTGRVTYPGSKHIYRFLSLS